MDSPLLPSSPPKYLLGALTPLHPPCTKVLIRSPNPTPTLSYGFLEKNWLFGGWWANQNGKVMNKVAIYFGHKNNKVVAFWGLKMNASLFIANLKLIHLKVGKSNCENGIHSNNPYA